MSNVMMATYDCSSVCIEDAIPQVSAPTFSENKSLGPGNTYTDTLIVTINSQAGTQTKYTTDGSEPTSTSPAYLSPINLPLPGSAETRIKALSFLGATASSVAEKTYKQTASAPPATGTCTSGKCCAECFVSGSYPNVQVTCGSSENKCTGTTLCQGSPLGYTDFLSQLLEPFYNSGTGHATTIPYNAPPTTCVYKMPGFGVDVHYCTSTCATTATTGYCSISTDVGHPLEVSCSGVLVCPPSLVGSTPGTQHACVPCSSSYHGVCINNSNTCCPSYTATASGSGCICQVPGCDDACLDPTKPPSGSGTPNRCCTGMICTAEAYATDQKCVPESSVDGELTGGSCFLGDDDYYRKLNCSGRCSSIPSDENGVPCVACGPTDAGVCATQPNGEIFDSCCVGYIPELNKDGDCICNQTKNAVNTLFTNINGLMIPITIILGIFLIVLKGYKIMTSQGDPQQLQEGKEGLTSAIIGLIFVLLAVSILRVIIKALISGDSDPFVM